MDKLSKNGGGLNDSPTRRMDSQDAEIYLTPKYLVDRIHSNLSTDGRENIINFENENVRRNVLGQPVPKRQEKQFYSLKDEHGYSLATDRVISTVPVGPLNTTSTSKLDRDNGTTCFQGLKKHRYVISAFVVGFIGAVALTIIGVVIYSTIFTSNIEPGNYTIQSSHNKVI